MMILCAILRSPCSNTSLSIQKNLLEFGHLTKKLLQNSYIFLWDSKKSSQAIYFLSKGNYQLHFFWIIFFARVAYFTIVSNLTQSTMTCEVLLLPDRTTGVVVPKFDPTAPQPQYSICNVIIIHYLLTFE